MILWLKKKIFYLLKIHIEIFTDEMIGYLESV